MSRQEHLFPPAEDAIALAPGATVLRAFATGDAPRILADLEQHILPVAPFRNMITPGGFRMSVSMTNCGPYGWVTDRRGYRYDPRDPETGRPWPAMPDSFQSLALSAATRAGYPGFAPDACLVNRYEPGTKLSLHQDRDEKDLSASIVSVSLGLAATFLFGSETRADRPRRIPLEHGDVVVWGGPSRLFFHGIAPLREPTAGHPLTGRARINLTFRKAR